MRSVALLGLAGLAFACASGPRHIAPYAPKERQFDAGEYAAPAPRTPGSLYSDSSRGLLEDDRASRVGDVLVIAIDERENAQRQSSTKLGRASNLSMGATNALGLMKKLQRKYPNIDATALLAAASTSDFNGNGTVTKGGTFTATLPVRVKEVLPNGDLYVEGTNVVMVSNEEHHLYVSGIVRRVDIESDNTVLSSRIANAEIEYVGRGDVSDQQRPGWAKRAITRGAPF